MWKNNWFCAGSIYFETVLIANLKTTDQTPEETYTVDGVRYDVASYLATTEDDTSPGFDVPVRPSVEEG